MQNQKHDMTQGNCVWETKKKKKKQALSNLESLLVVSFFPGSFLFPPGSDKQLLLPSKVFTQKIITQFSKYLILDKPYFSV